jgi:type I restriction enzyme, S subunit
MKSGSNTLIAIGDSSIRVSDGNYSSKYPKSHEFLEAGVPFISANNLRNGRVVKSNLKFISEEQHKTLKKGHLRAGDVLLVTRGSLGTTAFVTKEFEDANINAQLVLLRADNETVDSRYLFQVVNSSGFQSQVTSNATGTAQPQLPIGPLKRLTIPLPAIDLQRKIAGILSAYDDLIENNLRRIKILEEMAQSLYREWFVHFRFPGHESARFVDSSLGQIPKGWEVKPLFDVATVKYGKMLPKKDLADDGPFPVYGAANVIGRHTSFTREDRTIICGCRGSVGEMQITEPRCYVTNNSFTFDPVSANIYFWLFYTLSERGLRDVTGGAAQPQITLDGISQVFLSVPPDSILAAFEKRSRALAELAWNLKGKNQNLRRTRDLLLPKLLTPS